MKIMTVWLCNVGMRYAFTKLSICNTSVHLNCGWYEVHKLGKERK